MYLWKHLEEELIGQTSKLIVDWCIFIIIAKFFLWCFIFIVLSDCLSLFFLSLSLCYHK